MSKPELHELFRPKGCTCDEDGSPWRHSWHINWSVVCPLHFAAPDLLAFAKRVADNDLMVLSLRTAAIEVVRKAENPPSPSGGETT